MIAATLFAAVTAGLGTIGPQQLPERGCAAFLWTQAEPRLVAFAAPDPGELRLVLDGAPVMLAMAAQSGMAVLGIPARSDYARGDVSATLELTVVERQGLSDGAAVPTATITVTRRGQDTLIVPAAGLVGCTPPPALK